MRVSKLVGERIKESPSQATAKSHMYLLRAGYMKQVSNGIFTLTMPAQRISKKIQNIIREEMDKIDGQEVLFPVVMPKEMWEESGRYSTIGSEMVRFKDRVNHDMLLGMTHEEAAVHLCNNTIKSYDQLPFMIYQIQTKFRDEARPRAGLIRVREFTMKDAYSFHTSQEDLEEYYKKCFQAYATIYKRMGMKNVVAIKSDTGMMGGKIAHEFQLLTDIGEDSIVICEKCDYKCNMEVAVSKHNNCEMLHSSMQEVFTKDAKSIEEVASMLNIEAQNTIKAVCFAVIGDEEKTVIAFIRGDKEVNEVKLKNILKLDIVAKDLSATNLVAGNIGCVDLNVANSTIVFDESLKHASNMVTGANKEGYHIKGVSVARDVKDPVFYDISKVSSGDECCFCGAKLQVKRGIEVGNIFQLGTKYTKAMNMTIAMPDGNTINPIMGCYGIGVGRCIASVAEEMSDDKGLVWPISIAPWHVYICPLKLEDDVVKRAAYNLYESLLANKVECLFDDRNVSAGVKFADSELMGIPVRVVISPRSLANGEVEISIRETSEKIMVKIADVCDFLKQYITSKCM